MTAAVASFCGPLPYLIKVRFLIFVFGLRISFERERRLGVTRFLIRTIFQLVFFFAWLLGVFLGGVDLGGFEFSFFVFFFFGFLEIEVVFVNLYFLLLLFTRVAFLEVKEILRVT